MRRFAERRQRDGFLSGVAKKFVWLVFIIVAILKPAYFGVYLVLWVIVALIRRSELRGSPTTQQIFSILSVLPLFPAPEEIIEVEENVERYKRSPTMQFIRSLLRVVNMFIAIPFFFVAMVALWGSGDVQVSARTFLLEYIVFWGCIGLLTGIAWYFTQGEKVEDRS